MIAVVENCQGRFSRPGRVAAPTNILIVQTVKKDADALLEGELDAAAFRRRSTIMEYRQPALAAPSAASSK